MADIHALFTGTSDNVTEGDAQVCAATGSGKTVSFSVGGATSGVGPILVVVHTNRLKNQWLGSVEEKKGLRFLFGDEWVKKNVGIVQQGTCDYEGKQIVIAMAPSLCSRKYPDAFYRYFGVVGVDEVHKMATPVFNQVMGMFPAYYHVGLTATPKQGPMGKCITAHIGDPAITSDQTVMQPKVFRIKFNPKRNIDIVDYQSGDIKDDAQSLLNPLSRMPDRNAMLADIMFYRGYVRGRQLLGLSDRTDQLLKIKQLLIERGVPEHEIGMYVGAHKTGEFKLTGKLTFSVNVTRRDKATKKLVERREEVTKHLRALPPFKTRNAAKQYVEEFKREFIRDNDGAKFLGATTKVDHWWHKPKDEDYEDIEKRCRVVLATYGIFDTGIDIKRLDWGIELTPRGDVAQAVGRILRELFGKDMPEWYAVLDMLYTVVSADIMGQTVTRKYNYKTPYRLEKRRRASYHKQNAILIGIDNVAEAIEAAKQAHARQVGCRPISQRGKPQDGDVQAPRQGKPVRKLRLARR